MPQDQTNLAAFSSDISALAKQASASVAAIHAGDNWSSGFFLRPDVIVTASDALDANKGDTVSVWTAGHEKLEGRVLGRDPATDIALIQCTVPTGKPVTLQTGSEIGLGAFILAFARSRYGATCATGVVSLAEGAWESRRGGKIDQRLWLALRLARYAEGGPVVNTAGECIGMAVFGPRRRTLVISAATIERVGQELIAHGRIRRGYLGVSVLPLRAQMHGDSEQTEDRRGLMVVGLDGKGPARAAGIMQGDILLTIGGENPRSPRALSRLLSGSRIGESIAIELSRAGEMKTLNVTVGESPED